MKTVRFCRVEYFSPGFSALTFSYRSCVAAGKGGSLRNEFFQQSFFERFVDYKAFARTVVSLGVKAAGFLPIEDLFRGTRRENVEAKAYFIAVRICFFLSVSLSLSCDLHFFIPPYLEGTEERPVKRFIFWEIAKKT